MVGLAVLQRLGEHEGFEFFFSILAADEAPTFVFLVLDDPAGRTVDDVTDNAINVAVAPIIVFVQHIFTVFNCSCVHERIKLIALNDLGARRNELVLSITPLPAFTFTHPG